MRSCCAFRSARSPGCCARAASATLPRKRDELATSQLIEWHSISVPRREEQKAEA